MKAQMRKFNPKDAENYDKFIEQSRLLYQAVIEEGLGSTPFMDIQSMIKFIPRALKLKALLPAYSFVKKYFEDPRHRFTFSFHPLFIGGNPFRAPSIYLMIPYLEKHGGVWFTNGGMYSVVEAFEKVFKEIGGKVVTNAEVEKIQIENGRAVGVKTKSADYKADLVVSNADLAHTYKDLINQQHRKKYTDRHVKNMKYSMSAFLLYLGVKKQYPQLLHHTLILSERYKGLVNDIFKNKILPEDQSMYLHVPSRSDAGMAPEGSESMYVLIPVTNMDADIDWDAKKESYAKHILNFLEKDFKLDGLQENLEVLEIFTPKDFAVTQNAHLGSAWGVEPTLMQSAYFRPHNRSEDIPNLYFVGASTHPGAGVPGVLLTAEATEQVILSDFGGKKIVKKSA
jgi:phytoene desaturase